MSIFSAPDFDEHESVSFFYDHKTGLKCLIAIHNTNLGPALGGCRMWDYSCELDAVQDVLRLSKGMTYKAALAGLPLGGGKMVIIGDAKKDKNAKLLRAAGKCIETFKGRYSTGEDVGMGVKDMDHIVKETKHVVGLKGKSGDPSPFTAYGIYRGIEAAVLFKLKQKSLSGLTILVQGVGNVGMNLCQLLAASGVNLLVADINKDLTAKAVKKFGAKEVKCTEVFKQKVDVFSPCALGAVLNSKTIKQLQTPIIAGAANNQLAESKHGEMLAKNGILYAPDYVINAGGLINVSYEHSGKYSERKSILHVTKIYDSLMKIFKISDNKLKCTSSVADELAEKIFKKK